MTAKTHFYIRKTHRWLGVLIGIQFLCWTLGGLYFSWSDMDEVHGDYEKMPPPMFAAQAAFASPQAALDSLQKTAQVDSLFALQLVSILGKPHWLIAYRSPGKAVGHDHHPAKKYALADAVNGSLRPPLTEVEATEVARQAFRGTAQVTGVERLEEMSAHHEYREQPLPAFAVSFADQRQTTVYVAAELGTVQKFRNRPWRQFDFLWMLHTMDYSSRDHITNWLLRAFSIFGLATVASGFVLFFVSLRKRH